MAATPSCVTAPCWRGVDYDGARTGEYEGEGPDELGGEAPGQRMAALTHRATTPCFNQTSAALLRQ